MRPEHSGRKVEATKEDEPERESERGKRKEGRIVSGGRHRCSQESFERTISVSCLMAAATHSS